MSRRIVAWHVQARRMYEAGGYSKAEVGRHFGCAENYIYEVLSPQLYERSQRGRLKRQNTAYRERPDFRVRKIADARAYVEANPAVARKTGTGKYPLQIRCDAEFLAMLDGWSKTQPDKPSRSETVRRIVRSALSILAQEAEQ